MKPPYKRALLGVFIAPGAPLGWLLIRHMLHQDALTHMVENPAVYSYMLFATMAVFALFGAYVGWQESKAVELGLRDALTGLYNQRYFQEQLDLAFHLLARHPGKGIALAMLDIDHFKKVNDRYGHATGDQVLQNIAKKIAGLARLGDIVARVGGEEFAVIFQDTTVQDALAVAERIRSGVELTQTPGNQHPPVCVTISIGVAGVVEFRPGGSEALFRAADNALYAAKHRGRNCVVQSRLPNGSLSGSEAPVATPEYSAAETDVPDRASGD